MCKEMKFGLAVPGEADLYEKHWWCYEKEL